ncbi:sugar phosphate isomerase/epimerase family protein [Cohnella suwonensis]|uniref:Sugar phosphate isomerase/epimerase family protein n=1 Tax=Cohnella suwonensis TaxID=696072 RepID=A0ABW0M2P4_9BACL
MRFIRFGSEWWDVTKMPPGLELYTVRDELKRDYWGTLKKVADMGYQLVEFAMGYGGIPANQMKRGLNDLGLKTVSTLVLIEDLENDLHHQLDYADTIGVRYISTFLPPERFKDEAAIQESVSTLKRIGREVKRRGMKFLYHPHAEEYEIRNGKRVIDRLLEGIGTDLMQLELDLYWAKKGGLDPKEALLTYKGLSPLIHVKDMDREGGFTEVGRGTIDWPPIFRILHEVGVEYFFVEQDTSPHPLESAKASLDYLVSMQAITSTMLKKA